MLLLHPLQLSQSGLQEPSKLPEHTGGGSPGVPRGAPVVSTLLNSLLQLQPKLGGGGRTPVS